MIGQKPVMPNSTHCAAIHALFVHTVPANDGGGVLAVVVGELVLGVLLELRRGCRGSRRARDRREIHSATTVATTMKPTAMTSVVHRTRYSAAGSCRAKNRGICRSTFSGAPVSRRRARASIVDTWSPCGGAARGGLDIGEVGGCRAIARDEFVDLAAR